MDNCVEVEVVLVSGCEVVVQKVVGIVVFVNFPSTRNLDDFAIQGYRFVNEDHGEWRGAPPKLQKVQGNQCREEQRFLQPVKSRKKYSPVAQVVSQKDYSQFPSLWETEKKCVVQVTEKRKMEV